MKQQFNTRGNPAILARKMSEEEVIEEYIDCLDTFVAATRGAKATNLTKKDFFDFYSLMSLLVEENDEFTTLIKSHYLSNVSTVEKTNFSPTLKIECTKVHKQRKDQQESFNILKQGLDKMDSKEKEVIVDPKTALNKLSNKLAIRGSRGLLSFAKAFKKADVQKKLQNRL